MLFFTAFYRKARLGYPREFEKTSDLALAVPPAQAGTFRGSDKPFAATRPLMLARQRIWVVGRMPSALLPPGPDRKESVVLADSFRLVRERRFRGIVVTLWLRRPDALRRLAGAAVATYAMIAACLCAVPSECQLLLSPASARSR